MKNLMLHCKKILALAVATLILTACTVQDENDKQSAHIATSIDAIANISSKEFLFQVGGIQDIEETFIIENTQQEQILRMIAIYQQMTLNFQQIERTLITSHQTAQSTEVVELLKLDEVLSVHLSHIPIRSSLTVQLNNTAITDFSIIGQSIDFGLTAGANVGDDVEISYSYLPSYALPNQPAPETLQVLVDNYLILPELYNLSGQNIQLNFIPPLESEIVFSYRQNEALLRTQILGPAVVENSIIVSFDNVTIPRSSFTFDNKNGILEFIKVPRDNVNVSISYRFRENNQLTYDLLKKPSSINNIKVLDWETRQELPVATLEGYNITFHSNDFIENRELVVIYKGKDNISQDIRLTKEPLADSFQSNFQKSLCLSGAGLLRIGRQVNLDCELAGRTEVRFSYNFTTNRSRFAVHSVTNPEYGIWEVYFDEKKTSRWRREGNVIIVADDLPSETQVAIRHVPSLPKRSQ